MADGVPDAVELARADGAGLVIADLAYEERRQLHGELVEHLPGVNCLFVHQRYALDAFARFLGEASLSRDQSPPRN